MSYPSNSEAAVGDAELQNQISDLRRETTERFGQIDKGMAKLEAEIRVTKHDQANMKMGFDAFAARSERGQDAMRAELKEAANDFRAGIEVLTTKLSTLNLTQTRGAGFFAGVAASITICLSLLGLLFKFLTDHN